MGKVPRVFLAEDHKPTREFVKTLLEEEFEVVGVVGDGQSLVEAARRLCPAIIVLDISMPVMSGIEAARLLVDAGCQSKMVFLTIHEDPDIVREALSAGACCYVTKSRLASDLLVAVRKAIEGDTFVSSLEQVPGAV